MADDPAKHLSREGRHAPAEMIRDNRSPATDSSSKKSRAAGEL